MAIPDDVDISCPYQKIGQGSLLCACANTAPKHTTNETDEDTCFNCDAGKIFREVGCDSFTAKTLILVTNTKIFRQSSIFCKKRKRPTNLEYCKQCSIVRAPTTAIIVETARGIFQSNDFYPSYKLLEDARKSLRDGDYEATITCSLSSLESTLKTIYDKLGEPYPKDESVTQLWKSIKDLLRFEDLGTNGSVLALIGTLGGTVSHLGGLRNLYSDAHGRGIEYEETPFMLAELAINTSSTLSTFLIRRFKLLSGGEL